MKRSIRIILVILLIIFLYILWLGVGSILFDWKHGGGAIPTLLFFVLAAFIWRTITKQTHIEKSENTTVDRDEKLLKKEEDK